MCKSTETVSKGWFLNGHKVTGITHEIGEVTPKEDIEIMGRISVREMMKLLLVE